ncbi:MULTISPECIES: calcium/sodium antiporter [unclassified Hahella]|uniref:calcium/sodium antiporter n=1 Tax=unclassified Hahella TaxID=2624107 RepID=UPI001C1EE3D9|nr:MULTISPECIES: calcium/sodium antiporter [unclassified Hahella]MBU6951209.1 calcium/sodium antiporter [Hahella sp. HN01]MDG9670474.1 calcium/sodium antiporter [Hahella sp. CR1]
MMLALLAIVAGLALLVWSADRFVDGAAATAKHGGMPPLLIGMVIVGFGTSAPEMVVSALAASEGNPGLALGNGYGSNITNIALILGLVAVISPIAVHSQVLRKELPILAAITLLSAGLLWDGDLTRVDAAILLVVFAGLMGWTIREGMQQRSDALASEVDDEMIAHPMPLKNAIFWLVAGLILLIISSRILVWGAVTVAHSLGVSDLIIGLTIVAIGTSLPELASSLAAIRKGEHDLAIGNVIGSNLFNTLTVVGIAAAIHPLEVQPEVLYRDWTLMAGLTLALFVMGFGFKGKQGRINRVEGGILLAVYLAYTSYLGYTVVAAA